MKAGTAPHVESLSAMQELHKKTPPFLKCTRETETCLMRRKKEVIMTKHERVLEPVGRLHECPKDIRSHVIARQEEWLTPRNAAWLELALKGLGLLLGLLLLIP